jgi:hypothetical protein
MQKLDHYIKYRGPNLRFWSFIPSARHAHHTRVCENIAKCEIVVYYVMDGFRHYVHAPVEARAKKLCFSFCKDVASLLLYNIILRCFSLLTGNKPAVSWISGCQPPARCVKKLRQNGHTSKPGLDSDPDSDSKKIRTREKPGPGHEKIPDSYLKKPGLDFWKPGLEIDKTGFKTRTLCTRMQRFFGKV